MLKHYFSVLFLSRPEFSELTSRRKRVHPRFLVFQIISASMFSGNISIVSFAIDLGHKIRK